MLLRAGILKAPAFDSLTSFLTAFPHPPCYTCSRIFAKLQPILGCKYKIQRYRNERLKKYYAS